MVINDKIRFKQAFNRLAVATRLPADQVDAAMQKIYFDGLERFPIEAIESAAAELAVNAQWFPKLAEWCDVAERARNARALTAGSQDHGGRVWHAECATCDDTGWESVTCDGKHKQCGRERDHGDHEYVVPCVCRDTNRTYQRRRAEQRERARGRKTATDHA